MVEIEDEELEELKAEVKRLRERLEEVADEWATLGKIPDTPHGKRRWVEGD